MAIARCPVATIDCPDPGELARFYGAVLDWPVSVDDDGGWADIRHPDNTTMINFQRVADHRPPDWPGQDAPQQMHLDVDVDDLDVGEAAVVALGAVKHDHHPGTTFRVFLDPAGHPFCLCSTDRPELEAARHYGVTSAPPASVVDRGGRDRRMWE